MKPDPIPASLFQRNRAKLSANMAPGSVAIIRSGEPRIRSGDQYYPYRQHSDFFYLTGMVERDMLFAFFPEHPDPSLRELLFIRKSTPKTDLWTGPMPGLKEAARLSGIGRVHWILDI